MKEKLRSPELQLSPLVPEKGLRCGGGKWSPCGGRNTKVKDKQKCNLYECPYHEFDTNDHWG